MAVEEEVIEEYAEIGAVGAADGMRLHRRWVEAANAAAEPPSIQQVTTDARKAQVVDTLESMRPESNSAHDRFHQQASANQEAEEEKAFFEKIGDWLKEFFYPTDETDADPTPDKPHQPQGPLGEAAMNGPRYTHEDVDRFAKQMRDMIHRMKNMSDEEFAELQLEQLLLDCYRALIDDQEQSASLKRESMVSKYRERLELNKQRIAKLEEMVKDAQQNKVWGIFEKAVSGAGLFAVAATVSTPVGVIALAIGLGLVADSLLDDPAKKFIADKVTGDVETEQKVLGWLQLGCGLLTGAAYMLAGGVGSFNALTSLSQGTATTVKGMLDYQNNHNQADLKELDSQVVAHTDQLKKDTSGIRGSVNKIYDFFQQLNRIQETHRDASIGLVR